MRLNTAFFMLSIVVSLMAASCGGRKAKVVTKTESATVNPNAVDCRHYNDGGKTCKDMGIPDGQSIVIGGQRWECAQGCARSLGNELAAPNAGESSGQIDCSAGDQSRADCAAATPADGSVPGGDAAAAPREGPAPSQPAGAAGAGSGGSAPDSGDPLGDLGSIVGQQDAGSTGGGGGAGACSAYNRDGRTCADAGLNPGETKDIWGGTWQCVNGCAQMVGGGSTPAGDGGASDCRAYNRDGLSCSQAGLNPGETKPMWGGTWQCVNGCAQMVGG
jgi:hypothetical protein